MLGSLNTSSSSPHHEQQQEQEDPSASDLQYQRITHSPPIHMRQLLITCAELLSHSDFSAAHRLISILSANSSPYGDSTERLLHQFLRALSLRLNNRHHHVTAATTTSSLMMNINATSSSGSFCQVTTTTTATASNIAEYSSLQSCYLSLNQITPFIRFSHLTANQAILEAIQVGQQWSAIHILDFDIMHGVQWPPLMQALAERSNNTLQPPPMLRITATGHDLNILHRTGDRLLKFAHSLGIRFQFHPLLLMNDYDDPTPAVALYPDEALAVNCVFYLHRLDTRDLRIFLHKIKALNPRVVTIAESEANHSHPVFLQRFVEALDHYTAVFDSLEATLPPNSSERLAVEQIWFGREIVDIVAAEGENRRERHQRFDSWEVMLRSSGFVNVPLSPFALSQAKLLLRLHYPSEGYQLQTVNNSLFLGWQNRALFSVSSWH